MRQQNPEAHQRQYWLWVTRPEYYLDEDGNEREDLEPREHSDTGGWWTCSRETKKGDLILLWRARGSLDIKYLIQADSDAYPLGNDKYASEMGWGWGCDYRPIYKFKSAPTIQDLRIHERLKDWNALKAQFRSRCMKINPDDWQRLNNLAAEKNPGYKKFIEKVGSVSIPKHILLEEHLEQQIVEDLGVFRRFGYNLELYFDKENDTSGRQYVCAGPGGRMDLLCRNKKTKGYTIIELKNVQATRLTFGQICEYLGYIRDRLGKGKKIDGIVVSRGMNASFQEAIKMVPTIKHIDLTELGFK